MTESPPETLRPPPGGCLHDASVATDLVRTDRPEVGLFIDSSGSLIIAAGKVGARARFRDGAHLLAVANGLVQLALELVGRDQAAADDAADRLAEIVLTHGQAAGNA